MQLFPAGLILLLAGYRSGLAAPGLTGPRDVSGPLGESVSVQCHYWEKYWGYKKYWCRGAVWRSCLIAVESTGSEAKVKGDRVSIRDNPRLRSFTVTMENLTLADAGIYWCGISRAGYDPGAPVNVTVLRAALHKCWLVYLLSAIETGYFSAQTAPTLTALKEVSGHVGESLSVPCHYQTTYQTNQKYWCRGSDWNSCSKVVETKLEAELTKGRVSIRDNYTERTFTVTMENLTQQDAGTYWCGINIKGGGDANFLVHVTVLPAMATTGSVATTGTTVKPVAEHPTSLKVLLPLILLVLVILLIGAMLLVRRLMKRKKVAGAVGTTPASNEAGATPEGNVTYAAVKPKLREAITTAPSPPPAQAEHSPERGEYSVGAPGRTDVYYAPLTFPILDEQAIYTHMDRTSSQTPLSNPQDQIEYCELKKK